ncbi:uncharacterized protein LOC143024646 isoform X2 [Oratosquilla oratoria]|uniref:uncharacterized protein LOC143024646 isoform X2 n=1 Tax=Oratosquilla oratoria TaxID=337810 RepID=UPI003F7777EC
MRRGVPPSPSIVVQLVLLFQRMRLATFEYILKGIEESIKKFSNFCECISAKQRLAVTLRHSSASGWSFLGIQNSEPEDDLCRSKACYNKVFFVYKNFQCLSDIFYGSYPLLTVPSSEM